VVANEQSVDAHTRLLAQVAKEQGDVLETLLLCSEDTPIADRLWAQLVDLLVEGMFLDLRRRYLHGDVDRGEYVEELTTIAERCRSQGLLPLPARGL
jgi:hypothetical protein